MLHSTSAEYEHIGTTRPLPRRSYVIVRRLSEPQLLCECAYGTAGACGTALAVGEVRTGGESTKRDDHALGWRLALVVVVLFLGVDVRPAHEWRLGHRRGRARANGQAERDLAGDEAVDDGLAERGSEDEKAREEEKRYHERGDQ